MSAMMASYVSWCQQCLRIINGLWMTSVNGICEWSRSLRILSVNNGCERCWRAVSVNELRITAKIEVCKRCPRVMSSILHVGERCPRMRSLWKCLWMGLLQCPRHKCLRMSRTMAVSGVGKEIWNEVRERTVNENSEGSLWTVAVKVS